MVGGVEGASGSGQRSEEARPYRRVIYRSVSWRMRILLAWVERFGFRQEPNSVPTLVNLIDIPLPQLFWSLGLNLLPSHPSPFRCARTLALALHRLRPQSLLQPPRASRSSPRRPRRTDKRRRSSSAASKITPRRTWSNPTPRQRTHSRPSPISPVVQLLHCTAHQRAAQ